MTHSHAGFTTVADAKDFILGGNAIVTLTSEKTGKHFTFKIKEKKEEGLAGRNLSFVRVLAGPDNTSFDESLHIGFIPSIGCKLIAGKKGKPDAPSFKALAWVLNHLEAGVFPANCKIQHEGRCSMCSRRLTDPVSIERGVGPECFSKSGK